MAFCASCGAQIPDVAAFCPSCGKPVHAAASAVGAAPASAPSPAPAPTVAAPAIGGLNDNVAGMLAYITFIPAVVLLVLEPYNKRSFVRFHAFQCLFLALAWLVVGIVLMVIGMIPLLGIVTIPLSAIVFILGVILAVVCLLKAYQGEMWKLPIIGDMAEKQAKVM